MTQDHVLATPRRTPRPEPGPAALVGVHPLAWRQLGLTAAVLALGNTYLSVVLREAGPATRTEALQVWLRESLVLLPTYVVATLVAVTVLQSARWGGGESRRAVAPVAVTATGAAVGVLALVAGLAGHAAAPLTAGSVGSGALLVLATDAVLVALLVGLEGGRLPLVGDGPVTGAAATGDRGGQLGALLGGALLGSAVVHAAVIPEHLQRWPLAGEFFWLVVMAETLVGLVVLRDRRTGPLLAAAGLSLTTVLVWLLSRTSGLPLVPGAGEAEPVGVADLAATSLGLASLGVALTLLHGAEALRRPAGPSHVRALGLAAVVAVTAIGVAGSTVPVVSAFAPETPAGAAADHGGHDG